MSFLRYVKAAFNIPHNWVAVCTGLLLGFLNPGFFLLTAGVEAAYLYILSNSKRFQRWVDGSTVRKAQEQADLKVKALTDKLYSEDRDRYRSIVASCQKIIEQQAHETPPAELSQQAIGLSRLCNFYLQLLVSMQTIEQVKDENGDSDSIAQKINGLERRLSREKLRDDVRRSLEGQLSILHARQQAQNDAAGRAEYIRAELARIEEQIQLLREQTVASTDPSIVSGKIDEVTNTLTGTSEWIKRQKEVAGQVEELLSEPPLIVRTHSEE